MINTLPIEMPLIQVVGAIVASVLGWNAYWSYLGYRADTYMEEGRTYHLMKIPHRGVLLVCDEKVEKCFTVGLWGKPGPDPFPPK